MKRARAGLFLRTAGAFAVFSGGSVALLYGLGWARTAVAFVLTVPIWGSWGLFGATMAFTSGLMSVFILALQEVALVLKRAAAQPLLAVASKVAGSGVGIRLAALPELLGKWQRDTLGEVGGRGRGGRVVAWVGSWIVGKVRSRTLGRLEAEARKRGAQEISVVEISNALSSTAIYPE